MVKESTYSGEDFVRCVGFAALGIIRAIAGGGDAREERNSRRQKRSGMKQIAHVRMQRENAIRNKRGRKKYVLMPSYRSPIFTNSGSHTSSIEYSGVELECEPAPQEIEQGKREARLADGHTHVVVVGIRGAGKSSLINAFLGLQAEDPGCRPHGRSQNDLGHGQISRYATSRIHLV
jgi:hypothetical protein